MTLPWRKSARMDTIDFPLQLRGSLAAEDLAVALHAATCETYHVPPESWDELHADARTQYRTLAAELVKSLKPKPRLIGVRFNRFAKRLEQERNARD